jgi:hypothetical protein
LSLGASAHTNGKILALTTPVVRKRVIPIPAILG